MVKTKETNIQKHLKEELKDPYFKELYELEKQKIEIVKKIIAYRIKHNITQTELARRVGVTQQHISKIENSDFSSVVTLERVLLFIGLTVKLHAVPLPPRIKNQIQKQLKKNKKLTGMPAH